MMNLKDRYNNKNYIRCHENKLITPKNIIKHQPSIKNTPPVGTSPGSSVPKAIA